MKKIEYKKEKINFKKPVFEIYITMDSNDGDYISNKIEVTKEKFENELFLLVLCFINESDYYIIEDETFDWLVDYLSGNELLISCEDGYCHSYQSIEITYFETNGEIINIKLPSLNDIFDSKEEMIEYINKLYSEAENIYDDFDVEDDEDDEDDDYFESEND